MKNAFLALLGLLFFFAPSAQAEEMMVCEIRVEWRFENPDSVAVGFKLFSEGQHVITWDGDIRSGSVILPLSKTHKSPFAISAIYADGTESPKSDLYLFGPENTIYPAPKDFRRILSIFGDLLPPGTEIKKGRVKMG